MKVAIFGAGGVGGYFGGLLGQAGHEVVFIARGKQLEAMRTHGLRVISPHGDFHLPHVIATNDPQEIGPVEYLVVALKHYQLHEALEKMRPLIDHQTMIVPLLNGIDAHDILLSAFGSATVVGGLCSLASMVDAPGVIRHQSQLRRLVAGELDLQPGLQLDRLLDAWRGCGVDAIHSANIYVDIWTKFLFIASFGCVASLARASSGELLDAPQTRSLLLKAMGEVEALARAQGILLAVDVVEKSMELLESFEPQTTSSMQRDVASGRPFELDAFSGKIVALGRANHVPTPAFEAIDALLRPALLRSLEAG